MWYYTSKGDAIETLTCLETGAQVIRSGEGESAELWVARECDRPTAGARRDETGGV